MTSHPHLAHFLLALATILEIAGTIAGIGVFLRVAGLILYHGWWDKQSHWKWLHDKLEAWWHWIYWKKLATNLERWREIPHEESEYWRNFRRDKDIESCPTAKTMRIDR